MTDMRGSKVSDPQNLEFLFQDFDGFFTSLDSLSIFGSGGSLTLTLTLTLTLNPNPNPNPNPRC